MMEEIFGDPLIGGQQICYIASQEAVDGKEVAPKPTADAEVLADIGQEGEVQSQSKSAC